ncbi:MAG: sulfurtransferase-like selenium metabolism protein YedF [Bacillota bacterium]|jgi:selenium metabolism protein YedF
MFVEVNCKGLECPKPVIKTKEALEKTDSGIIVSIVDNEIARDNVLRLAKKMNLKTEVREVSGNYQISIDKTGCAECAEADAIINAQPLTDEYMILVRGETLGRGDDELGAVLAKSFFFTAANYENPPKKIAFLNGGVKLTCINSPVLESLQALNDKGVEIISCGTCLDYYHIKDQLAVGRIGNMYDIFEAAASCRTISI